jgi:HEAT repeat protein
MIEVLGTSGDIAAVPVLVPLVRDRAGGLDHFAAVALGRLGTPSGRALVELAKDADPGVVEKAIVALGEIEEPRALPVLLALAEGPAGAAGTSR